MLGNDALVQLRGDGRATLSIVYDERPITADARDTVSSALLRAGVVATSRSLKFRRPRGPFCLRGDCGTCLVRIDGVPNLRACTTAVRDGMRVAPQNRVLERGPDPTALVDKMFGAGMDHHHLMLRPKLFNRVMQEVARNLAGLGTLPDAAPAQPTRTEHHTCDALVVGA
ncbi:MAG: (2Fe-2S)-binding protein, partial [Deltaproteobacteria bacterium]|nr:(2Fe-2S)-binding protein [Nannocystaceae bacterium]